MPDPRAHEASVLALPDLAGRLLDQLREKRMRVHAITNTAAQVFTANLLLAAGGIPSLTVAADEVAAFVSQAAALLVNLGTLDADRRASIPWAIAAARAQKKPWVLDPVFVDLSPPRLELARLCLIGCPAALRCSASEFASLAGSDHDRDAAVQDFAKEHAIVVALTGPVDRVIDGTRSVTIDHGHPLMSRVAAMGCAATALIAAFNALHDDPLEAAAAALLVIGIAGEIAAERARGPGSFEPIILDSLYGLDRSTILARASTA